MNPTVRLTQFGRLLSLSCALTALLVAQPRLRIISPADGTVVSPGGSLAVTVEVNPPTGAFQSVFVAVFEPIGYSKQILSAPPYRFTLQIPSRTRPDKYPVTAVGFTGRDQVVMSDPIDILVERTDLPVRLRVSPTGGYDLLLDEKGYLEVTGEFADGTKTNLAHSSHVKYVSSAPAVATVDSLGGVTPVAPGSARVTVNYGDFKVEVPVTVRGGRR